LAIDRNKIVAEAQKHIQKGAYKKAIAEYSRIIREEPDDVRILMKIGDLQVRDGQARDAQRTYTEVADYYVANGFFLKAVAVYKQVLQLNAAAVEPRVQLAELYFQLGLLSDALTQYLLVAQTYQQNGQGALYVKTLERMVEVDPSNVGNRIKLAETLAKAGSAMSAAIHFSAAAHTLQAAGRFDEYVKVAERYLHVLPEDVEMSRELARTLLTIDKPVLAIQRMQPFLKKARVALVDVDLVADALQRLGENARGAELLREIAEDYEKSGLTAERDHCLRKLLEFDPTNEIARRVLGLTANDDVPELDDIAFEVLDDGAAGPVDAVEREAQITQLLAEAEIFAKYNLHERMLDHLNQIFALDADNVPALHRRATALVALGRTKEAASTYTHLARVASRTSRDAAMPLIESALAQVPGFPEAVQLQGALQSDVLAATMQPLAPTSLRESTAAPVLEEIVADKPSYEELDSLFAAFDVEADDHAGDESLDQDQSFLRHIAEVDNLAAEQSGQRILPGPPQPAVPPPELEAELDRVDALAEAGKYFDAQTLLLNLTGEYPEFADRLLARMDMLPIVSSIDAPVLGDAGSGLRPYLDTSAPHPLFAPEPTAPRMPAPTVQEDADDDGMLFLDPDDDDDSLPPDTDSVARSTPEPQLVAVDADGNAAIAAADTGMLDDDAIAFLDSSEHAAVEDEPLPKAPEALADGDVTVPPTRFAGVTATPTPAPVPFAVEEVVVAADFDEPSGLIHFATPASAPQKAARVFDAPVGRASNDAKVVFAPTERALAADPGSDLARGIELRRDGNAFAAVEALQSEVFGDFPVAAQFEFALASIEMGMFFDGVHALQELFNADELTATDHLAIKYYLGIAYEALAQGEEALPLFQEIYAAAPNSFPDLAQRIARI
jgi:tetratricopeptide (TPR) repeat protein